MKRFESTSSATAAWTLMPGILPFENGVSNTSNRPDAVVPTKTILLLGGRQVEERVGGVGALLEIGQQRRTTEIDEAPLITFDAVRAPHVAPRQRHHTIADDEPVAGGADIVRRDAGGFECGGETERRQDVRAGPRERHRVPQGTVGIEDEEVVPERVAGLRQRWKRRIDDGPMDRSR
jgi:hypothetical protein